MLDDSFTPVLVKRDGPRGWKRINKKDYDPAVHELYVPPPPEPESEIPLPPPPPPVHILDALPTNWRTQDSKSVRELAERVTGRTAENKPQAVEMIEQALAARSQ